jgi:DNA-binding MarR family transcriptional regulator
MLLQSMIDYQQRGLEILRLGLWNHKVQNALSKEVDLPVYELECVVVLFLEDPESASALADKLGVRNSSLSKILRRLELRGLVNRSADTSDRRRGCITLSPAGRALAEQVLSYASAIAGGLFELLPEERRGQFLQCVRVITSSKLPQQHQQLEPND